MRLVLNSGKCGVDGIIDVVIPSLGFDVEEFYLLNAIIPFSFYIINSTNNTVIVNGVTITLEQQNYNNYELATELKSKLITTLPSITVLFYKQKNKFTITNSASFTIQFKGNGAMFGFLDNVVYTSTYLAFSGNTYTMTSPFVADSLNGLRSLYIRSNLSTMNTIIENSTVGTNLLYRIPVDRPYGSILNYLVNNSDYSIPVGTTISKIRLTITDANGTLINFNGVPYEIVFYLKLKELDEIVPRTLEIQRGVEEGAGVNNNTTTPYNLIDWNNLGINPTVN